jgi:glycosyltransferase involved in cell wall biosynthesis
VVTVHDIRYLENIDKKNDANYIDILKDSAPSPDFIINDFLSRENLMNHLRSTIEKTIRRADLLITVSKFSKGRIIDKLGISPEKIKVIYHGIDKQFAPQDEEFIRPVLNKFRIDKPYILYIGKFEPLKNINRLLEAFQKVVACKDISLVMAGPVNWYYYVLLEQVRQLNIAKHVVFTDFVSDTEMIALYSGASVFVSPSLYEGFGFPLLEAMACGIPIVTSNVCSIPEVVGDAAVFADPYSPLDIADKIVLCLENEDLRVSLINKGRKQAQSFTWEDTALKTYQVYCELCQ